jgi:hypothetical protein
VLPEGRGAARRGDRQRSQGCAGGLPQKNLKDVLAEDRQRCPVGSQLAIILLAVVISWAA